MFIRGERHADPGVLFQKGRSVGFISDPVKQHVYGRPVGIAVLPDGSILVADDSDNKIWRVSVK